MSPLYNQLTGETILASNLPGHIDKMWIFYTNGDILCCRFKNDTVTIPISFVNEEQLNKECRELYLVRNLSVPDAWQQLKNFLKLNEYERPGTNGFNILWVRNELEKGMLKLNRRYNKLIRQKLIKENRLGDFEKKRNPYFLKLIMHDDPSIADGFIWSINKQIEYLKEFPDDVRKRIEDVYYKLYKK